MCVLYVSFGSKVRHRTFVWVAMCSTVLFAFIVWIYCFVLSRQLYIYIWVYVFLGCTRACVYRCDGDVIYVCHDLNQCSGWWYVCSITVEYFW